MCFLSSIGQYIDQLTYIILKLFYTNFTRLVFLYNQTNLLLICVCWDNTFQQSWQIYRSNWLIRLVSIKPFSSWALKMGLKTTSAKAITGIDWCLNISLSRLDGIFTLRDILQIYGNINLRLWWFWSFVQLRRGIYFFQYKTLHSIGKLTEQARICLLWLFRVLSIELGILLLEPAFFHIRNGY